MTGTSKETDRLVSRKPASFLSMMLTSLCYTIIFAVIGLIGLIIFFLYTRLGFGQLFPAQPFDTMAPLLPSSVLEIIATLPTPPGNLAVSSYGMVFFNFHPEYDPAPTKIARIVDQQSGDWKPYPSLAFQSQLITCLSMRIDHLDRLWLLDFAQHGLKGSPRLLAFDVSDPDKLSDTPLHDHVFPADVAGIGSMLNDFQVDQDGKFVYIVDTSIVAMTPALVIYDINARRSHRIIDSHPALFGTSTFLNVAGTKIKFGPFGLNINVDSVALSRDGNQLFMGAVTSNNLYSISTSHIHYFINRKTAIGGATKEMKDALHASVVRASSSKPVTDGLSSDLKGNIWLTAFEKSALAIASANPVGKFGGNFVGAEAFHIQKVVEDADLLRWPDGLSFGPDGLYITNSALHYKFGNILNTNKQKNASDEGKTFEELYGPFHILRIHAKHLKEISGEEMPPAGH